MQRDPLPPNFVVAKPIDAKKSRTAAVAIREIEKRGTLIVTRKRDGHKVLVEVCLGNRVRIFRSGMGEIDHRLDYIRQEVRVHRFPVGTVLIGELVVERLEDGRLHDDVGTVGSVLGGSFKKAQEVLAKGPLPTLFVFNALFPRPSGTSLESKPYHVTLHWIQKNLNGYGLYVRSVERVVGTLPRIQRDVTEQGWEGLVL